MTEKRLQEKYVTLGILSNNMIWINSKSGNFTVNSGIPGITDQMLFDDNSKEDPRDLKIKTSTDVSEDSGICNLDPITLQKSISKEDTTITIQTRNVSTQIITFHKEILSSFYLNTLKGTNAFYHPENDYGSFEATKNEVRQPAEKIVRVWTKPMKGMISILIDTDSCHLELLYSSKGNSISYVNQKYIFPCNFDDLKYHKIISGEIEKSAQSSTSNIEVKKQINGNITTITISDTLNTLDLMVFRDSKLVSCSLSIPTDNLPLLVSKKDLE